MVALITDVHYRMSPALIRVLAKAGVQIYTCERAGYTSLPGAHSKYVQAHFILPKDEEATALYRLIEDLGKKHQCKPAVLPIGAVTLQRLAKERERFGAVAGLCIATPEQIERLNDKRELHRLADSLSIALPKEYDLKNISLPCVVKPTCGEKIGLPAKERYRICHTEEQVKSTYNHFLQLSGEKPIIQEYLSGYGFGCSVVAENGKVCAYIGHRRLREYPISGGPSSCCVTIEPPVDDVERLVHATNFSGLAMFEFKNDANGTPRLLECNPRIWGSFPLTETADSSLPFTWFAAAWNNGNPNQAIPLPENQFKREKKMVFFPSDLLAGVGYLKNGNPKQFFGALSDLMNPVVKDGVFRWNDAAPSFSYYKGLLKRGGKE